MSKGTSNECFDCCPQCNQQLVSTYWLASTGKYPVKEVVRVPGKRCESCNYVEYEYNPHEDEPSTHSPEMDEDSL